MRDTYPSDVTREEFSLIEAEILATTKSTHPRKIDVYDIFCAVLYRLREGCRWRSLPHDFPNWKICYYHYNLWRKTKEDQESTLDRILGMLVQSERVAHGRAQQTTMIIVDSKSIKNTDTAEEKGFDAGKNFRSKVAYCCRCSWVTSCYVCQHSECN